MKNDQEVAIHCEAIIFDLDGTLVDSAVCIEKVWKSWAAENSIDYKEIEAVFTGRTTLETMQLVAPQIASKELADAFALRESKETEGLKQIKGAKALLDTLPKGLWAIATSGSRVLATSRIQASGLTLPQVLVTSDDVTKGKPNPEPFIKAANLLDVKPENCLVFEDSNAGIQAALAAGAKVIGINADDSLPIEANLNDLTGIRVKHSPERKMFTIIIPFKAK